MEEVGEGAMTENRRKQLWYRSWAVLLWLSAALVLSAAVRQALSGQAVPAAVSLLLTLLPLAEYRYLYRPVLENLRELVWEEKVGDLERDCEIGDFR
jgi:hypothetical protein